MKFNLNECIGKLVSVNWLEDGEEMGDLIMIYNEVDYNSLSNLISELIEEDVLISYYIYENN
jgi:(2Fe-2S) ferredoxin